MVKKQIPKEPNQNSSATPEFDSPTVGTSGKLRRYWDEKPLLFEDFGFILYCFGMDCIYFQNGLFLFFLASFIVSFSNYEAKFSFFSTMLYVIVFKLMCYYVQNRIY